MYRILVVAALTVAGTLGITSIAIATPVVFYFSPNGNLMVRNDGLLPGSGANNGKIDVVVIKSVSGALNAPTFPRGPIPGASVDLGDLPNFIALLDVPKGDYVLGPGTVDPWTSFGDLAVDYIAVWGSPPLRGAPIVPAWPEGDIPEPAALLLVVLAVGGVVAATRRRA
ncbi:MAG: hypothetical protein DCC67_05735 [Planctomycetota bacterium]|nr:MAG: hypothetical protein DCC67_05735 [Planctomycetota bacterium]